MNKDQLRTLAIEALLEENPHAAKMVNPLDLHILKEEFYPKDDDGNDVKNPSLYSVVLREGYHFKFDIAPEDRPVPIIDTEGMPKATQMAVALAAQLDIDLREVKAKGSITGKIGVKDIYRVHTADEAKMDAAPEPKAASKPMSASDVVWTPAATDLAAENFIAPDTDIPHEGEKVTKPDVQAYLDSPAGPD